MKLKNRKTGEIGELHYEPDKEYHFMVATEDPADMAIYRSLAELNSDWEDYKPSEPLIKDEKIRKAVRAWAEANEIKTVEYDEYWVSFRRDDKTIGFKHKYSRLGFYKLENSRDYTIDELCGEEEE